jgi:membrane protein YqaA with SNARE-associated domain
MSLAGLFFATLAVSAAGGLVPVVNVELWLVGVAATAPQGAILPVALAASLGQTAAKALLYRGGEAVVPSLKRRRSRASAAVSTLERGGRLGTAIVFSSALTGLPPLYAVSLAAGLGRFPLAAFLALTWLGRFLRFALVFLLPRALLGLGANP